MLKQDLNLLKASVRASLSCAVLGSKKFEVFKTKSWCQGSASLPALGLQHFSTNSAAQQQQSASTNERMAADVHKEADTQAAQTPQVRDVLYRGAFMQPFRLLVRFKIFQLVGIASLAIPINTFLVEVMLSNLTVIQCSCLHGISASPWCSGEHARHCSNTRLT